MDLTVGNIFFTLILFSNSITIIVAYQFNRSLNGNTYNPMVYRNPTLNVTTGRVKQVNLTPSFRHISSIPVASGKIKIMTDQIENQRKFAHHHHHKGHKNTNTGMVMYGPPAEYYNTPGPAMSTPSNIEDMDEALESILKGVGIGIAIGFGIFGGATGLAKLLWIPLLLVAGLMIPFIFFLFLVNPIAIPLITTSKMMRNSKSSPRMSAKTLLMEKIDEVMKMLPDLTAIQTSSTRTTSAQ